MERGVQVKIDKELFGRAEQKWQQVEEREARRDGEEVEVELDKF